MSIATTIHATAIAFGPRGVLIMGPPGSGKSDLALRLIDQSGLGIGPLPMVASLISDDQTQLVRVGDSLVASPPAALAGLLEIRGLGILRLRNRASAGVALVVRLTAAATIDRMPELSRSVFKVLDVAIPMVMIDPTCASAPARVRAAIGAVESEGVL